MIDIASRFGYLSLDEFPVESASPAGNGTVDGDAVTYDDVTIDVNKAADAPDLTEEERTTIAAALPLPRSAGYSGTTERFSDGSSHGATLDPVGLRMRAGTQPPAASQLLIAVTSMTRAGPLGRW